MAQKFMEWVEHLRIGETAELVARRNEIAARYARAEELKAHAAELPGQADVIGGEVYRNALKLEGDAAHLSSVEAVSEAKTRAEQADKLRQRAEANKLRRS